MSWRGVSYEKGWDQHLSIRVAAKTERAKKEMEKKEVVLELELESFHEENNLVFSPKFLSSLKLSNSICAKIFFDVSRIQDRRSIR